MAGAGTQQPLSGADIVPRPENIDPVEGSFTLNGQTAILVRDADANAEVLAVGRFLAEWLRPRTGFALPVCAARRGDEPTGNILLAIADNHTIGGAEAYQLSITPERVGMFATHPRGLFYAVQTLRQLFPPALEAARVAPGKGKPLKLAGLRIADEPRYPWRGMLLDCGRHFMDKEFVKRYIDLLAYHKMNVLHWHLTEDQGWRIEIKKYPKLTQIGAWRKLTRESEQPGDGSGRYGGFYSQDDIREIVAYAKAHYVTVVPEIELPGHSGGALAAYPELSCSGGPFETSTTWGVHKDVYCAGNDQVFEFLEGVLDEVCELFPSEYIHIGGDECPKDRWKTCPKCQARIKAEGLKDEHELQSYFVKRIEKYLNSKGKRIIGWDEILEGGLAPNATVQSWRGMQGAIAAAASGHDVIASPTSHCYLDYPQAAEGSNFGWMGMITLEQIYSFEPTPGELSAEQARHILGAEANIWTEQAPQQRVDHQVFPRLCALAEVTWSPKDARSWPGFQRRMVTHEKRLDALGVMYYVPVPRLATSERVFTDQLDLRFQLPASGVIRYTLKGAAPTNSSAKAGAVLHISDSCVLKARVFLPTGNAGDTAEFRLRKLTPHEPVHVDNPAAGLDCEYYEGRWLHVPALDDLTPKVSVVVNSIDLGPRKRDANFALRFRGFIETPADDVYTFYLSSDDGSRLWIGSDLVVDFDGVHAAGERSGQVILKAGLHPLSVEYFQVGGKRKLELAYEGPSFEKRPLPKAALFRSESQR